MNLKSIKDVSISWSVKKKAQDIEDLVDIEFLLTETLNKIGFGFSMEEDKSSLVELETWKRINLPTSITVDENVELMKPVTFQEIHFILSLSKNDKSVGLDGIAVEVYRTLFDVLGEDLLQVVDDSQKNGKIHAMFNTTFVALIPKTNHPKSFEYFRPISICNYIYKIMGIIISTRIRKVFGRYIFGEQFGFFSGR